MEIDYLEIAEALEAYAEALGCSPDEAADAVLNEGQLGSALARPRHAAAYEEADLVRQAATLFWGMAANHAFRDGNKRTAVAILRAFLFINGHTHDLSDDELFQLAIDVATGTRSVDQVEAALRPRIMPDDGS